MRFIALFHHVRFPLFACLTVLTGCGGMDGMGDKGGTIPAPDMPGGGDAVDDPAAVGGGAGSVGNQAALGGQSGGASGAANTPACYCGFSELAKARVVSTGDDGECAVFELLEKPTGVDDYHSLSSGDRFGGHASSLCQDGLDVEADAVVYVRYWPGDNASNGCLEYKSCSQAQCGSQPQEDTNAEGDSAEFLDQIAAWDACDGQCIEDTREACAVREDEALFSGTVTVAGLDASGDVVFTWGETYAVSPADIADATCAPDGVPQVLNQSGSGISDGEAAAAPPPAPPSSTPPSACEIPE